MNTPVLTKQISDEQCAALVREILADTGAHTTDAISNAYPSIRKWFESVARDEPTAPIDAGLRFSPVLCRNTSLDCGWEAEMEQAHDGEWVHISALNRDLTS